MDTHTDLLIHVEIEEYIGFFSAHSDDVPGLHVGGETMELTRQYIAEATRLLFKFNRHMDVAVVPAGTPRRRGDNGLNVEEFIVQQMAA